MLEKLIASGIKASATTSPAETSTRSRRGDRNAARTDVTSSLIGSRPPPDAGGLTGLTTVKVLRDEMEAVLTLDPVGEEPSARS